MGLATLGAIDDLELDGLAVFEGLVAVGLDLRPVDEHVVLALDGDEAVALVSVEPLHGAAHHRNSCNSVTRVEGPTLSDPPIHLDEGHPASIQRSRPGPAAAPSVTRVAAPPLSDPPIHLDEGHPASIQRSPPGTVAAPSPEGGTEQG